MANQMISPIVKNLIIIDMIIIKILKTVKIIKNIDNKIEDMEEVMIEDLEEVMIEDLEEVTIEDLEEVMIEEVEDMGEETVMMVIGILNTMNVVMEEVEGKMIIEKK